MAQNHTVKLKKLYCIHHTACRSSHCWRLRASRRRWGQRPQPQTSLKESLHRWIDANTKCELWAPDCIIRSSFWSSMSRKCVHRTFTCPISPSFYRYTVILPVLGPEKHIWGQHIPLCEPEHITRPLRTLCTSLKQDSGDARDWEPCSKVQAVEVDLDWISSSIIHS